MGGRVENRYLNWQIVNLKVSVDDLHDAPILYISGSDELKFTSEEMTKLRAFAEQGGLILGNANCNSDKFSKSFETLGTTLFPKYNFRPIPTNHLIYVGEQYNTKKWKTHPRLRRPEQWRARADDADSRHGRRSRLADRFQQDPPGSF